jgi:hypothetical protein
VSRSQNTFEPAEEQLHCPTMLVGQRYQIDREVQAIGQEPKFRGFPLRSTVLRTTSRRGRWMNF